jgi:phospholipase C
MDGRSRLLLSWLCLSAACDGAPDAPAEEDAGDDPDAIEWLDGSPHEKPDVDKPGDPDAGPDVPAPALDVPAPALDVPAPALDVRPLDAPVVDAPLDRPRVIDAAADVPRDAAPDAGGFAFPTPIRHVVVLIRENRTFDSMFSGFPGAESATTGLRSDGTRVPLRRAPDGDLTGDIRHNHEGATMAFHGGRMNWFDRNADLHSDSGSPLAPFVHYPESLIPNYWQYARRYVLCDHFFSTSLAGSSPGHFAFWTAQVPLIENPECPGDACADGSGCFAHGATATLINQDTCAIATRPGAPCFDVPTVVDAFPSPLTWRVYANGTDPHGVSTPLAMARGITRDEAAFHSHTRLQSSLIADLRRGDQSNLLIAHVGGAVGEHPPHGLCPGEGFATEVVNAIMAGPHWRDTAILLTYDDWGGFYDHVSPPQDRCANGDHVHLGFRLPLIVVSPYSRRSADPARPFVFHGVTDQTSVTRLIEDVFRLPRLHARDRHARDASAGSLLPVFDFAHPDFAPMPLAPRRCP